MIPKTQNGASARELMSLRARGDKRAGPGYSPQTIKALMIEGRYNYVPYHLLIVCYCVLQEKGRIGNARISVFIGPWGSHGNHWDDGVFSTIKQIQLFRGEREIRAIQIVYCGKNGESIVSKKHGWAESDIIDKVLGSKGSDATKKKYGPFGNERGTYFTSGKDGKVVGFYGQDGAYLDAIGHEKDKCFQMIGWPEWAGNGGRSGGRSSGRGGRGNYGRGGSRGRGGFVAAMGSGASGVDCGNMGGAPSGSIASASAGSGGAVTYRDGLMAPPSPSTVMVGEVPCDTTTFLHLRGSPKILEAGDTTVPLPNNEEIDLKGQIFLFYFQVPLPLVGGSPYAQCYGGHQFSTWDGQLGDGRSITLGELLNSRGQRWELQLKGAGKTPYSRFADGLAVLRSSIHEFLCGLGIPTTRALSLVMTGKCVTRDMFYENTKEEPSAIVCRVAKSFLRFGSFQIHASTSKEDLGIVRVLADYTIRHHFPHIEDMNKSDNLSFKTGEDSSPVVDLTSNKYV
ncbi:hypothetical protein IFM89_019585, partial [Coptis chinensis]